MPWKLPTRVQIVPFLWGLLALAILVGGYGIYWKYVKPDLPPTLAQVTTQGGIQGVGVAPEVKAIRKAIPGVKRVPQTRPVVVIDTASLPDSEKKRIPTATPGGISLHIDNVAFPDPVLTATAEVPKTKAGADVRSYLTPSGETILTVEPRKEGFFGWEPRNLELEGGYGIGGKQIDASGAWYPVRLGAFHFGAKAETWMEEAGGMKGAASIRVRWEPFR
jgi:hypothetical protein